MMGRLVDNVCLAEGFPEIIGVNTGLVVFLHPPTSEMARMN
jgi:hypothetical protein